MNKSFLNFLDSQKLHRLEIESNSGFSWDKRIKEVFSNNDLHLGMKNFSTLYVPVYTDADLNDVLPDKIIIRAKTVPVHNYDLVIRKTRNGKFCIEYENQIKTSASLIQIQESTEVEAKAKMILYLNKKKLLK